ncbi:MAG: glycosyltransferase [Chloroflexi bacterium]|nr:MAG: glycosyltransferase [Chloroflexota bacterium]MBL1193200.1 glycosyltransferase [Chloroflexota bacterium]NOH10494.1 glycosyltransferase family 2 protein [Chloroflexota bacterium]
MVLQKEFVVDQEVPLVRANGFTDVSIVIPVFNEVESLPELHKQLHAAMQNYPTTWEVIFIDDGSRDGSLQALEVLAGHDPEHTRVVALRRNFGQTAAISAGIDHAAGDIIVLLDADLQNDPADIPLLLDKIDEGYDLVSGWRRSRKDTYITRTLPSNIANGLISRVTGVHLHDYGCTLKAYRREVLTGFRLYGEMHRFIPAYAGYVGANITEVEVNHRPRQYGETSYGLERTVKVVLDLFTVKFLLGYVNKPIYLFGGFGMGLIGLGLVGLIYLFIRKYFFFGSVADSPIFFLGIVSLILGVQSIFSGLIAEMGVRTYHESQSKPIYNVRYVIRGDQMNEEPDAA